MDGFELEIKRDFINEALGILQEAEHAFIELEASSDPAPLLSRIFRLAHNLKGSSRAVGFGQIAEFTHQLESLVLRLQKGELELISPIITTLLRSNDCLVEMLTKLKEDYNAKFDNSDMLQEIQNWINGKVAAQIAPTTVPSRPPKPTTLSDGHSVKVNLRRIERLHLAVEELNELQGIVRQQFAAGSVKGLQVSLRKLTKLARRIRQHTLALRRVPVKPLAQKLHRVARDTAHMLGKEVILEVDGDGLKLDKSVVNGLADPLIHIIRNSVDHGLETPETRLANGKPRVGRLHLLFKHEGTDLVVEVRDDGRGINPKLLRRRAVEMKLISRNQTISDDKLIEFIFHPGFTTKSEISEISGRGVGMDIVKHHVEALGGSVVVKTNPGQGSMIRLQIPLIATSPDSPQKAAA